MAFKLAEKRKIILKGLGALPPDSLFLATFKETEKCESRRIVEKAFILLPSPVFQQTLDAAMYERNTAAYLLKVMIVIQRSY